MGRGQAGPARRLWQCLVAALVLFFLWSSPAPAARADDDLLVASDPYQHQELTDPPSGVVLAFSREVDAAAAQIVVTNSAGKSVNINSLIVEGTNVTAQVKPNLPEDTYTVHYQVNRKDGQVEGGAFQFAYGKGTWTNLPDERWSGNSAQPTVIASEEPEPVATPSDSASPTPSESASEPASATPAAPSTPPAVPGTADGGTGPWLWAGLGGLVVAAAGGGYAFYRRGRSGRSAGA